MVRARSYLFTYPFWIVVDRQSPPAIAEVNAGGYLLRLYPPFRSGPANFIPMPAVNPHAIPFIPGTKPEINPTFTHVPTLAAVSGLTPGGQGGVPLRFAWGADWGDLADVRDFPMDSLRVDIVGPNELDESVADEAAKEASDRLTGLLRWRSRQWWIGRSVDALAGYLRVRFSALEDGTPTENLQDAYKYTSARTARGDELAVTADLWDTVVRNLRANRSIPTHELLLMDAIYFEAIRDIRRSVLDCAAACELVKDAVYGRKGWTKASYDLPKQIGENLQRFLSGRSYETDHPEHFAMIDHLWDARGNITHSGRVEYRQAGKVVQVDSTNAKEFIRSAEHCVAWLEGL